MVLGVVGWQSALDSFLRVVFAATVFQKSLPGAAESFRLVTFFDCLVYSPVVVVAEVVTLFGGAFCDGCGAGEGFTFCLGPRSSEHKHDKCGQKSEIEFHIFLI